MELPPIKSTPTQDWGEAVDASFFYGRIRELTQLKKWILQEQVRLIVLLGMGGIGKTALSVKLALYVKDNFDYIIWRCLRFSPSSEVFFQQFVEIVSPQTRINTQNVSNSISHLVDCLRSSRCLIVLDHVDSILYSALNHKTENYSGISTSNSSRMGNLNLDLPQIQYLRGYEAFGEFIQRLGESQHQSCLLLTSREKLQEIAALEGDTKIAKKTDAKGIPTINTRSRRIITKAIAN